MSWEKRKYRRAPLKLDASLTIQPDGPAITVNVVDLSEGGASVLSALSLDAGQAIKLSVRLPGQDGASVHEEVAGQVVHVRDGERPDLDGWILGIRFCKPLDGERQPLLWSEMQAALSRMPRADGIG